MGLKSFVACCSVSGAAGQVHPEMKTVTIPLFGLDESGKSTLLDRLRRQPPKETKPTWGFVTANVLLPGDAVAVLRLFDVGGHERIRGIWTNYIAEAHAICYVVDGSQPDRFAEAAEQLHRIYRTRMVYGKPLLIFVNKRDAPNCVSQESVISALRLDGLLLPLEPGEDPLSASLIARTISAKYAERKGQVIDANILDGFSTLLHAVHRQWAVLDPRVRADTQAQREAYEAELEQRKTRLGTAAGNGNGEAKGKREPEAVPPSDALLVKSVVVGNEDEAEFPAAAAGGDPMPVKLEI
ncbi:ADP-ribosylation factor-like protein 13B [Blastocladiella emersonii ATCC 22665]|nr:ADP-ribosylation factor-like protein 13B [Blastocladiella emersonii ATCC 22665]